MRLEPTVPADALAAVRAPLESAGATLTDAPLLQPLNLILDLAGEAMRSRLFIVQAEGEAESCLRPDFTVAIAQNHLASGAAEGRYLYQGKAFRTASGADRPEEFLQLGLELLSANGPVEAADAEIAGLAWRSAAAGGRGDLTLWLGDVGLLSPFIDSLGLPGALAARLKRVAGRPRLLRAELARVGAAPAGGEGALSGILAGLTETQAGALLEEVWALAGIEPVGGRGPAEIAARLVRKADAASAPALTELQGSAIRDFMAITGEPGPALAQVRALAGRKADALAAALKGWDARLAAIGKVAPSDRLRFSPSLGHAFDYYDGLTLEVVSAALGPDRPVAVGGRYDSLLARLGGAGGVRAVGCMVRPWRAFAGGEA